MRRRYYQEQLARDVADTAGVPRAVEHPPSTPRASTTSYRRSRHHAASPSNAHRQVKKGSRNEAEKNGIANKYLVTAGWIRTTDLLIHSQLSSHDTTRQIRSLAPRKHPLFFDFYHHVGNCQRHGPTRPDAGSVLPVQFGQIRATILQLARPRGPDGTGTQLISVRDLGCGRHLENWLSWQGPKAIRSFSASAETSSLSRPTRSPSERALA
jgi:hypothetical protein